MANRRFIDFPVATTVGANDIILIWQDGLNKQTTKATILSGLPEDLEDLADVNISGLTNGQILRYDSPTGKWVNTDQGNLDLDDLNDVSIVSPTNGQVLFYNSSTSKWENSSILTGYVPYTGATQNVDLGEFGVDAGFVQLDTTPTNTPTSQGTIFWDEDDETVDVVLNGYIMKIGEDQFYPVKNQTGSSIAKGTSVRFAGTVGASGRLLIAPFIADGSVSSSFFMGVTAEAIADGEDGKVLYFGRIRGINTNAFNEGDVLYASTTVAGGFQTAVPVAPNNIVQVAAVINKSINQGVIFIRPSFGSNINQDEGVKIVSPTTGQLLQLQAGGLWENKTKAEVLGGTSSQFVKGDGSLDSTVYVTIDTNQTITGVKTFTQGIVIDGININNGGSNTNTFVGLDAGNDNTTGATNSFFGAYAGEGNTTGDANTFVGYSSGLSNTTGGGNSFFGNGSGVNNISGSFNSFFGLNTAFSLTTGSGNTFIGNSAGSIISNNSPLTSATNSVFLGAGIKANGNSQTNQIIIGNNTTGNGSNTVTIGNSSITNNYFTGNIQGGAFIKSGGTSAQFLKADGSVDSNTYVTGGPFLPLSGGTLTGALNGTSASFTGSLTTGAPSGGTAKPFKVGAVATVSPTSPDRTIEIEIEGTTYYLSAKTTNN
jgi:hypothetical protein